MTGARFDPELAGLLGGIFALLVASSLAAFVVRRRVRTEAGRALADNLDARVRAWWAMVALVAAALALGPVGVVGLFAFVSFLALREFVTLTPTRRGDHRALLWCFFVFTPVQYALVGVGWYGMFVLLIPVYAFLAVPAVAVLAGETEDFLARTARMQWGLMVCVYCVSHAPALLMLRLPGYAGENAKLLVFLLVVVQLSDVFQYVFGKLFGRHKLAPTLSPNKTWEGLVGGVAAATAVGAGLWWATPYRPVAAGLIAFGIAAMGVVGGLVMSAIKRDRGIKDFGTVIEGHGGVLDRIDSVCFAAPLFFHLTRFFYD